MFLANIACPVCLESVSADRAEDHANRCLDATGKQYTFTLTAATRSPAINLRKAFSVKGSNALVNSAMTSVLNSGSINSALNSGSIDRSRQGECLSVASDDETEPACPLCSKEFTSYSPQRKKLHINKCIESSMLSESVGVNWDRVSLCMSCHKPWKTNFTLCSKLNHLRMCGQSRGYSPLSIVQMVKDKCSQKTPLTKELESFTVSRVQSQFHSQLHTTDTQSKYFSQSDSTNKQPQLKKTSSNEVISISSDEDFAAIKILIKPKKILEPTLRKQKTKQAPVLETLEHADIISRRRKNKLTTTSNIMTGSPLVAYTSSKIRNLKLFTDYTNANSNAESETDSNNGLRSLSILPTDPFSSFFKPYATDIDIQGGLTLEEQDSVMSRIEVRHVSTSIKKD